MVATWTGDDNGLALMHETSSGPRVAGCESRTVGNLHLKKTAVDLPENRILAKQGAVNQPPHAC